MIYNDLKNIKEKNDLYENNKLKFDIDKPIISNNYLFHSLINLGKIKLLEDEIYPIYKFNNNNYDGFMIAANNQDYETLKYLILKYPEYIYNTNKFNLNWIHLLDINKDIYDLIIDKSFEFVEWKRLLYMVDKSKNNTMDALVSYLDFSQIKNLLKYFDLDNINLINLFNNPKLNDDNVIYFLNYFVKNKINFNNIKNVKDNFIYSLLIRYNKEILEILYKYKKEHNQGIYGYAPLSNGDHSFIFLLQNYIDNDYKSDKLEFIFDYYFKFKEFLNIHQYNNSGTTLIMTIFEFKDYLKNNLDEKLEKKLFEIEKELIENGDLLHTNIYGDTLMHLLVSHKIKYSKFIKSNFKTNIKNIDGYTTYDLANDKWREFFKKSKYNITDKTNEDIKIKYIETNKSYFANFIAYFLDIGLQLYNLTKLYPNFTTPKIPVKLLNSYTADNIIYPDHYVLTNQDFAWSIIWNNKDSYYIHPNLNLVINKIINDNKYQYVGLLLSYRTYFGGLHAMPILYDLKNKTIERWDSYGDNSVIEDLDSILEEKLTWNTGLKYLGVNKLTNIFGIQDLSNERLPNNTKSGDFGGYCAAWTIWFIEHKILNPDVSTKQLIDKTIKKITQTWCDNNQRNHKIVDFIRDYSKTIQLRTEKLFKKQNWSYNEFTNNVYSDELGNNITKFIEDNI
jgi:hypothetical protein